MKRETPLTSPKLGSYGTTRARKKPQTRTAMRQAESRDLLRDAPGEHADRELGKDAAWRSPSLARWPVMLP